MGSAIQSNEPCKTEVNKGMQPWWSEWRRLSGVIYARMIAARVEGLHDGNETCNDVLFGDSGGNKKTGGGV